MSRKTLITFLFITIVLIVIALVSLKFNNSYKYSLVNTANDEGLKETSDKINDNFENENCLNYSNVNNVQEFIQAGIGTRDYNNVTSRNMHFDRIRSSINNTKLNSVEETFQESAQYVDSVAEKVLVKEDNLHGVKIFTYNNITYDVYSNGYKEISNLIESFEVDNSGYNGNTGSLKNQAVENVELHSEKINSVLEFTNKFRRDKGLDNCVLDNNLCVAASVRALEMSYTENLSHTRPDGAKCFVVLDDLDINYNSAGENIADGFKNSEKVCNAWKNSEEHYRNIISKKYNKVGIGVAQSLNGKYYWVQIFSD